MTQWDRLLAEAEQTGKFEFRGYRGYRTRTGWRTYPGYNDVRFPTALTALNAIMGWTEP